MNKQRCTYGEHAGSEDKDAIAWSWSPYGDYKVFYCDKHLEIAKSYSFNFRVHYVVIEDET